MHGYFKFTQPLFIQALMGLKGLFDAKPVAIHILNKSATGDLKRPFTTPSLMGRTFSSIVPRPLFIAFFIQLHRVQNPILLPLLRLKSVLERKRRNDSSVRFDILNQLVPGLVIYQYTYSNHSVTILSANFQGTFLCRL